MRDEGQDMDSRFRLRRIKLDTCDSLLGTRDPCPEDGRLRTEDKENIQSLGKTPDRYRTKNSEW